MSVKEINHISFTSEDRTPLAAVFSWAAKGQEQAPSVMTQLLGKNYLNEGVMKTNVGALTSGANAAVNLQAGQATQNVKAELSDVKADFQQNVEQLQTALTGAMDQASQALNIDPDLARNTFMPMPQSSDVDAIGNKLTSGVTAAYDVVSTLPKLNPEQQSKVVAKMVALMTPKRDEMTGEMVERPVIDTKYAAAIEKLAEQNKFTPEFLKEAMKPAEEQPEWTAMMALESKINAITPVHERDEAKNEALAMIEKETGIEIDATQDLSVDPEIIIPAIALAGQVLNDPDFSGVKAKEAPNVTDITELLKRNTAPDPAYVIAPPTVRVSGMDGMMG
ncbi:MAG: hypothetical protein IT559_08685 [Alphaproteobacteria bacterium]|nr:hypothetical protein [Alphaproteobacteria bacterium]